MTSSVDYTELNEVKADFNSIYVSRDPRSYFTTLGQFDYIIPHLAQPVFEQLIRARALTQAGPVTVLDLGCSYGVNGALMKYALRHDVLAQRYTDPVLRNLSSSELLALDRNFFRAWPRRDDITVLGLDPSENAILYAEACGALDAGFAIDLENEDPSPADAEILSSADLIVSTGCVGYIGDATFARLAALERRGQMPWVASFVLRMFPYDAIERTLADFGLATEKLEGTTFVQRRFTGRDEMAGAIQAIDERGLDPYGLETEGLFHAELYLSRPQAEIDRVPLSKLVSVVSGANKPWPVATHALQIATDARERVTASAE